MVFNLLPFPPLDGFHVLEGLVSKDIYLRLQKFKNFGPMILLGLIILGRFTSIDIFGAIFSPFISILGGFLLGGFNAG